ncbi:MAG: hypothetical protein VKI83_12710 [Synechococcaceae cyanobacterium]|nr:hypothetical protein [Synechococcaceae cyanobacterium]
MSDDPAQQQAQPQQQRRRGWPLWLRLLLAAAVLAFVWSPFLAMLVKLSNVNPSLAPDSPFPAPTIPEPATTPQAPTSPEALRSPGGRPAPSP